MSDRRTSTPTRRDLVRNLARKIYSNTDVMDEIHDLWEQYQLCDLEITAIMERIRAEEEKDIEKYSNASRVHLPKYHCEEKTISRSRSPVRRSRSKSISPVRRSRCRSRSSIRRSQPLVAKNPIKKFFAMIDTEGGIIQNSFCKNSNTYYIGLIGLLVFDENYNIIFQQKYVVDLGEINYDDFTAKQKGQWYQASVNSHKKKFTYFTKRNGGRHINVIMREVMGIFSRYNIEIIYSKGNFLEKRLMTNVALNGVYKTRSEIKNTLKGTRYRWVELNDEGVEKYQLDLHDPILECIFFLQEIKRLGI